MLKLKINLLPLFSITNSQRHLIEFTKLFKTDCGIESIPLSIFGQSFSALPLTMAHKFSIGFRSGFCAGQGRLVMSFSLFQSFTIRAVWIGALFSWKISYIFLLCKLIKYWVLDFFENFIIQFDSHQFVTNIYEILNKYIPIHKERFSFKHK